MWNLSKIRTYDLTSGTNTYIIQFKKLNIKKFDVINGNDIITYNQAHGSNG